MQKLLASIKGKPEEYAIKLQFLKSLKRAAYDTNPVGHYGLAKVNYTHFTSPIRRYADLVVHRVIAREKAGDAKALAEAAAHVSKTERVSSDAERDSTQLKKMEFFQRQLTAKQPQQFRAIVVDVRAMGVFVELPDIQITGLIHVSALGSDFFNFDPVRQRYQGRKSGATYQLGDALTVVVARIDASRRQIDFAPVGQPVATSRPSGVREARADQRGGRPDARRGKPEPRGGRPDSRGGKPDRSGGRPDARGEKPGTRGGARDERRSGDQRPAGKGPSRRSRGRR